MKKAKICLMILITIIIIGITKTVSADLELNTLEFEANIQESGDMKVTEYWDIRIQDTNTLYKYFERDSTKFSGIQDVLVTDITNGGNIKLTRDLSWQYHVTKNHYYGTLNKERNFEIGWGVGLDNSTATREYKIEYTVKDAITKYEDCAELYWQFIGNGFEVPAKKVTGKITLPQSAENKEDIRVWGHTEELNGEIYATSANTIEFKLEGYKSGNMLEVRILFPTGMIQNATRTSNIATLQKVIEEETKWVEEANAKRLKKEIMITSIVLIVAIIINMVIIIKIRIYRKKQKTQIPKYIPENKLEYYREIPRNNATPGEALRLINKSISDITSADIGKIFSAGLLDLNLKGFIQIDINQQKKREIIIRLTSKEVKDSEELGEERNIYSFLKYIKNIENGITIKELQKQIERYPTKIEKLTDNMNKQISKGLKENELIDEKAEEEYKKYSAGQVIYVMLIIFIIIASVVFLVTMPKINYIVKISMVVTIIITITGLIQSIKTSKKINIFTQKGVNEIEEWNGLKKYMKDYSLLHEKEVPAVAIWEKYLVFATAFGISKEVIKQLKLVYPNFEDISTINSTTLFIAMNTDFNRTFSNAINTSISSSYSSATGGGGGFSGGGGGGRRPVVAVEVDKIHLKPTT